MNLKRKSSEGHISRALKSVVFMVSLCVGSSLLASIDYKVGHHLIYGDNTDSDSESDSENLAADVVHLDRPGGIEVAPGDARLVSTGASVGTTQDTDVQNPSILDSAGHSADFVAPRVSHPSMLRSSVDNAYVPDEPEPAEGHTPSTTMVPHDLRAVDQECSTPPEEPLVEPHEKLLQFCQDKSRLFSHSFLCGDSADFDWDGFMGLLFDCIAVNSQDKVEINGEVLSVADALRLDSVDAMHKIAKSIEDFGDSRSYIWDSEVSAYLLMMNSFFASLSSRLYGVQNRIRPEDKSVNLIINYLVYSGCLEKIGAESIIKEVEHNLRYGEVDLRDFAINLARLVFDRIGRGTEDQLKEQINNCFNNCKSSFKNWTKEGADKLIEDSIYKDRIVFVKDWWNVSREELQKISGFLDVVLDEYIRNNKSVKDIPEGVRKAVRPYVSMFALGIPFCYVLAEYNRRAVRNVWGGMTRAEMACLVKGHHKMTKAEMDLLVKWGHKMTQAEMDEVLKGHHEMTEEEMSELLKVRHEITEKKIDKVLERQQKLISDSNQASKFCSPDADFIAREKEYHFWPIPFGVYIDQYYISWIKKALIDLLRSHDRKKSIEDLLNKGSIQPYAGVLATGSYDDFSKNFSKKFFKDETVEEMLKRCVK